MIHILNGDALLDRFPESFPGRRIVCRECLVDGDVDGKTLDQLVRVRESFLQDVYGVAPADYRSSSLAEWKKITALPSGSEVALWFEDDLFCQVNLWFVCWLLEEGGKAGDVFLVRPPEGSADGFGSLDSGGLAAAWEARTVLTLRETGAFARLWKAYQHEDADTLRRIASVDLVRFPFLPGVIRAEEDRYQDANGWSPLERRVADLIAEDPQADFASLFRQFTERDPVFGFGDLQFRRVLEEVRDRLASGPA